MRVVFGWRKGSLIRSFLPLSRNSVAAVCGQAGGTAPSPVSKKKEGTTRVNSNYSQTVFVPLFLHGKVSWEAKDRSSRTQAKYLRPGFLLLSLSIFVEINYCRGQLTNVANDVFPQYLARKPWRSGSPKTLFFGSMHRTLRR